MQWSRRWEATWIWWEPHDVVEAVFAPVPPRSDGFGYLRTTIELDDIPARARCRITADGRYELWVNGSRVGRGPVRSEPSHLTYDTYELELYRGANAIGVLARTYAQPTVHWKPAEPVGTLGLGSVLFEADIDGRLVTSDDTWRALPAPYRRTGPTGRSGLPPIEVVDGRSVPWGWTRPDFDDSGWAPASVCEPMGLGIGDGRPPTEPFGLLGPRPIPHLVERDVGPVSIVGRGEAGPTGDDPLSDRERDEGDAVSHPWEPARLGAGESLTVDMGAIVTAHPELDVDAEPGTVIDLDCGEDLTPDGAPVVEPRRWALRYTAAGVDDETIAAFEPVGFRYLKVAVRSGSAASVSVRAVERTYPRPDGPHFECSDPFLSELWKVGARTLDLCSMDAYVDCPGREQRAWLGDDYVVTLVSFACNPDTRLAAWDVRLHSQGTRSDGLLPKVAAGDFTDQPVTLPDCSLHWVRTLTRVWEHVGDRDLVVDLLPTGLRALDWFERHRGPDGLLRDLEGWVFIDWAQTERGRQTAAVDALYVLALQDMETLARVTGDAGLARRCRERARTTRRAFARYWDRARGVYVDAADPDRGPGRRVSQQTNSLAILSGCAPRSRWDRILDRILDEDRLVRTLTPGDEQGQERSLYHQWERPDMDEEEQVVLAQPYFAHFLHQAVVAGGRARLIPELCRRWRPMVERGNGCLEEYWTAGPGLGSRCHAWSATPTYDLSTHVLGIRPAAPGWERIEIAPELGDLDWAEGEVPTPYGPVRARFGDRAWVEIPEGVTASVRYGGKVRDCPPGRTEL